jgi:DNA-binding GntR family transcriptional regulator
MMDNASKTENLTRHADYRTGFSHEVYNHIVAGIIEKKYAVGHRVTEKTIASQLEVSTVPVRDAFQKLEHDGWIERIPYKGAKIVNLLDKRVLKELYATRHVLEEGAVYRAAKHVDTSDIEQLRTMLDDFGKMNSMGPVDKVLLELRFHCSIVSMGSGSRILSIFEANLLQCQSIVELISGHVTNRPRVKDDHRLIVDALAEGDAKRALEATHEHIEGSYVWLVENL